MGHLPTLRLRSASIAYLIVVDGEHYPPVIEAAIRRERDSGREIAAALVAGGTEKLPPGGLERLGEVPVLTGESPVEMLGRAIEDLHPEGVLDLSDEPVMDYRRRHRLASVALIRGVPYEGADFRFEPPPRPHLCRKPSLAVVGTGKRTGKTAVAGFAARTLAARGWKPAVVAMGRGGPPDPEVLRGDEGDLGPEQLLALADAGRHAASDYIEDALLARVPTVGCRRCGGGLAGAVDHSNVAAGIEIANRLPCDLLLLEGSGAAVPPAHADATVLVAPASIPDEYLTGYFGPYRLLLSDLVVVSMCEEPFGSSSRISAITSLIRNTLDSVSKGGEPQGDIRVVRTVFRPSPVRTVDGARVFVATTAPPAAGEAIRRHLQGHHGCLVTGITHALADRAELERDLGAIEGGTDVLLCEIKAAAVDVATRWAMAAGLDVVYMDNEPVGLGTDDPAAAIEWAAGQSKARFKELG